MTRRVTVTEADMKRAIRVAEKIGKVALMTRAGIAFVDPDTIPHDAPVRTEENSCDAIFGVKE